MTTASMAEAHDSTGAQSEAPRATVLLRLIPSETLRALLASRLQSFFGDFCFVDTAGFLESQVYDDAFQVIFFFFFYFQFLILHSLDFFKTLIVL